MREVVMTTWREQLNSQPPIIDLGIPKQDLRLSFICHLWHHVSTGRRRQHTSSPPREKKPAAVSRELGTRPKPVAQCPKSTWPCFLTVPDTNFRRLGWRIHGRSSPPSRRPRRNEFLLHKSGRQGIARAWQKRTRSQGGREARAPQDNQCFSTKDLRCDIEEHRIC